MTTRSLGIMVAERTPPFREQSFYVQIQREAARIHLNVFVFSAASICWNKSEAVGFFYDKNRWVKKRIPLPDVIYDRSFYSKSDAQDQVLLKNAAAISKLNPARLLSNPISGKWQMHQVLSKHTDFACHLPLTEPYTGIAKLKRWMANKQQAILKPVSGSQGRGIIRVRRTNSGSYIAVGRSSCNRPLHAHFQTAEQFYDWIDSFTKTRLYLVQQYLNLTDSSLQSYDVRALVQKNAAGLWQLTGTAVRVGIRGGITSNLHGGGKAKETMPFLSSIFGTLKAKRIYKQIRCLTELVAPFLEQYFGRLAELGIDYGIDEQGRVWILEVNSKPGRSIFVQTGERNARMRSILSPIHYARYLVDRQLGG